MVIWVHNICYARFVFNKFSFQKKTRRCVVIHDAPSFFSLTIKIDSFF